MKKILCLCLALAVFSTFVGCGEKAAAAVEQENTNIAAADVLEPEIETPAAVADTENTEEPEVFVPPENYAAVITVTINPQLRLYVDADNVVLACECVNEDAGEITAEHELVGTKLENAMREIVQASIDKGFLTEEKANAVQIEFTEVKDEAYAVKESVNAAEAAAVEVVTENAMDNAVETSMTEETEAVAAAQVTVCPDCGGTGYTCPNCGGHEAESCFCCKGTGYQTCTNCRGAKTQTCFGCHGAGGSCNHCGGSGKIACEVCGGAGGYTCSRCYGFTIACPDCEYAVEYCATCGGTGELQ